jgi:GT2 family glycosyltransferase
MPDLKASITICSWNTKGDLEACLRSLELVREEAPFEVIVFDNNSADGSPDMVEETFPWVRLIRSSRNLGFTGGQNHAVSHRLGRDALLLNSDTIVHEGAIRQLVEYAEAHPECGIIGPRLLNSDGSLQYSCRRFPNPLAALFRNTVFGRWFPNNKYTREYLMTDLPHDRITEVDWVSGAALYAQKAFIDQVGLLDPEYFMFSEDVDWCFRCWAAGFKVVYLPTAVITHAIGRSTDKAPNRMIGGFHRSMFRFYKKNMASRMNPVVRPLALFAAGTALLLRAGMFILKNKMDNLRRMVKR